MPDDAVGYGQPPTRYRFKPGVSGNPNGRPRRIAPALADIINDTVNGSVDYRQGDRTKAAPALELCLKTLVDRAVAGDLDAADNVLKAWTYVNRRGGAAEDAIAISGWLRDYPGQTAEEKTRAVAARGAPRSAKPSKGPAPDEGEVEPR